MSLPPSQISYQEEHASDDARPSVLAANVVSLFVASVATLLRFLARRVNRVSLRADDYLIMIALVLDFGFLADSIYSVYLGLGRHIIFNRDPVAFAKAAIAIEVFYGVGMALVKLSVIFLYRRIFPVKWLLYAMWAVGSIIVCFGICSVILNIFQCVPVHGAWDTSVDARCINFNAWVITHGSQNVVTDFILLCLPMPLVWKLRMPTTRKIQVSFLFILGGFASIASLVRITLITRNNMSLLDASWDDVQANIWSVIELSFGIVCACAPTLGPLFNNRKRYSGSPSDNLTSGLSEFRRRMQRASPSHQKQPTLPEVRLSETNTSRSEEGIPENHSAFNFWEASLDNSSRPKSKIPPAAWAEEIRYPGSSNPTATRREKDDEEHFNINGTGVRLSSQTDQRLSRSYLS